METRTRMNVSDFTAHLRNTFDVQAGPPLAGYEYPDPNGSASKVARKYVCFTLEKNLPAWANHGEAEKDLVEVFNQAFERLWCVANNNGSRPKLMMRRFPVILMDPHLNGGRMKLHMRFDIPPLDPTVLAECFPYHSQGSSPRNIEEYYKSVHKDLVDPGHSHNIVDPIYNHTHGIGIYDPGHSHTPHGGGVAWDGCLMRDETYYMEVYRKGLWMPCDSMGRQIAMLPPIPKVGDVRTSDQKVWNGKRYVAFLYDYEIGGKPNHDSNPLSKPTSKSLTLTRDAMEKAAAEILSQQFNTKHHSDSDASKKRGPNDFNPLARIGSKHNPLTEQTYAELIRTGYKGDAQLRYEQEVETTRKGDRLHNRRLPVTIGGGAKQIHAPLMGFNRIKDI